MHYFRRIEIIHFFVQQMPNDLVPIDVDGAEVGWSRGAGVDQWAVVYGNIVSFLSPSASSY